MQKRCIKEYNLALDELYTLCNEIDSYLKGSGIVLLIGEIAAGKTSFVKSFAKFLQIECSVTSPTFSIQSFYGNHSDDKGFYHYDIYNKGVDNFLNMGLIEDLEKDGYHFIEWADDKMIDIINSCGFKKVLLQIEAFSDMRRVYKVSYE